jgi:hypothetical protein
MLPSGATPRSLPRQQLIPALFVLVYAVMMCWFRYVQVTESYYFSGPGILLALNNVFRTLYIVYFALMLWATGRFVLAFLDKRAGPLRLSKLDHFIASFITGAALLTGLIFAGGFLNLYHRSLAILLNAGCVLLASQYVPQLITDTAELVRIAHARAATTLGRVVLLDLVLLLTATLVALLLTKGLYPSGYFDYFNHYLPYYMRVLDSRGIWPNDVYYQYFYSKGAGLLFHSMWITDTLAPSLVSYAFVCVSALALGSLVNKVLHSSQWALAAMIVYLAGYIYTPTFTDLAKNLQFIYDDALLHQNTLADFSWGYFQKHHTQSAAWICVVAWMAIVSRDQQGAGSKAWTLLLGIAVSGLVILAPTAMVVVVPFLALMAIAAFFQKRKGDAARLAAVAGWSTALVLLLCGLNYLITGMPEHTPIRVCWQMADQERFSQMASPYETALLLESSRPELGKLVVPGSRVKGIPLAFYLGAISRAEILRHSFVTLPILLAVLAGSLVAAWWLPRRGNGGYGQCAVATVALLVPTFAVAAVANQPVSLYRNFEFCMFFTAGAGVMACGALAGGLTVAGRRLWAWCDQASGRVAPRGLAWGAGVVAGAACGLLPLWIAGSALLGSLEACPPPQWIQARDFAAGTESVADAYRSQYAIDDDLLEVYRQVGPKTRVWNLNWQIMTAVPSFWLETSLSFRMGTEWHTIMFESPEEAKRALIAQDRSYFVINVNAAIEDMLRCSPLFCPDNIDKYLGVVWESGKGTYLLTWRTEGTRPLPPEFLERYRKNVATPVEYDVEGIYDHLRSVYIANGRRGYPVPNSDTPTGRRVLQ